MQQRVDYGTTYDVASQAEILEIERHLKALKSNVEKQGVEKTFVFRAEALLNFIRLCCTLVGRENPSEKVRRRLYALFNLCASCWLHMLDLVLPVSIVRVQRSFIHDEDHEDFENGSILRHYLKDDQQRIRSKCPEP